MTEIEEVLEETQTTDDPDEPVEDQDAHRRTNRARWGVVAAVVIALVATAAFVIVRRNQLPDNAVLRFDGEIITKTDYTSRVNALSALYGVQPPKAGAKATKFRKDAAKSIAVGLILDKAAKDDGIEISDKEASTALDKIIDEQLPGGRSNFTQFLGSTGISEGDVLDEVKRQLATSRLFDKLTADAKAPTGADISTYYDDHQSEMATAERRRIANIVLSTEREADQVLSAASAGTQFDSLARQYSLDSSTKDNGGDLGWLTQDQLASDFGKAAFAAQRGVPFGPVQSEYGWNVGVVVSAQASQPLALTQVTDQLKTELLNQRKLSAWRTWLAKQIKAADIEYADAYKPKNPDAAPSDLPTSAP